MNATAKKNSFRLSALVIGTLTSQMAIAQGFSAVELSAGYQLSSSADPAKTDATASAPVSTDKGTEHRCGEGKCGEGKCGEGKCGEGKCGEGKCGEGKCGEGKCGEGKCGEGKCGEGKCGEGKCGEGKCGEAKPVDAKSDVKSTKEAKCGGMI